MKSYAQYSPESASTKSSSKSFLPGLRGGLGKNLWYNVGLIIFAGVAAMVIMVHRENAIGSTNMAEYIHSLIVTSEIFEVQRQWNYSSFRFEPNVQDWDQQRASWMEKHKELGSELGAQPRIMMVTGSSPDPCEPSILSHLLLRSAKNKLDYCRIHEMELYYNMAKPDPEFSDWWVKLPVIRMLMLQHPELEWIWWLDADAILTDMSFVPPFSELEHHNLVLYGDRQLVYRVKDWKSVSTANFMMRNCQWSLDLLDAWGSMGTTRLREESGKFQSEILAYRPSNFSGDDQSSMVAVLAQDHKMRPSERQWTPWVKLVEETEYVMNGNWTLVAPLLEELSLQDESNRVPFVTHFKGCLSACTGEPDQLPTDLLDTCSKQLERACDFADNQVYRRYGYQPRALGLALEPFIKSEALATDDNTDDVKVDKEYSMPPRLTDWDERREVWMKENPSAKWDEVLLVSGSAPKPCESKAGGHIILRAFKNKVDYARINGISKHFYNMAVIDKDLTGWWSKLPVLKMLMLNNPNVEWIWWMDSDAALTDMDFKLPFSRYNLSGYNLAMYGTEQGMYEERSYTSINTGSFLIRNCQWSLNLLDKWASFGATSELRVKNEDLLNNYLSDRPPGWDADDQCVLVYVLVSEREKWESQVCLETSFAMSGYWAYWITTFGDEAEWTSPEAKPFVTHFAGCHPCSESAKEDCLVGMHKTYNFADNQVLRRYGLRHVHIDSFELLRTSPFVSKVQEEDGMEDLEAEESEVDVNLEAVHTANDKQTPAGELAETKDALNGAAEEDAVATGSTEFDPASKGKEVDRGTKDEEVEKVSKE